MEQQVDELAAVMMNLDRLASGSYFSASTEASKILAAGQIEILKGIQILEARLDELRRKLP